jgi:hypothetical protein
MKNPENLIIGAAKICRASPIGTAKAPRFAFKHRDRCCANNGFYIASLLCPELAYKFGSTDQKRKYGKIKMKSK